MARKTYRRRRELHEAKAHLILQRHESIVRSAVALPIPIEDIIERTMRLSILYDDIPEPPSTTILGALSPSDRTIIINTRHSDLFEHCIGPERFTLAHELGHWVYDAESPDQQTLGLDAGDDQFCYHREGSSGLPDTARIREINANNFASCLLMPRHLLAGIDVGEILTDFRSTAGRWGISQTALMIRLKTLNLIDDRGLEQLQFN